MGGHSESGSTPCRSFTASGHEECGCRLRVASEGSRRRTPARPNLVAPAQVIDSCLFGRFVSRGRADCQGSDRAPTRLARALGASSGCRLGRLSAGTPCRGKRRLRSRRGASRLGRSVAGAIDCSAAGGGHRCASGSPQAPRSKRDRCGLGGLAIRGLARQSDLRRYLIIAAALPTAVGTSTSRALRRRQRGRGPASRPFCVALRSPIPLMAAR